jgi:hypothetical protein
MARREYFRVVRRSRIIWFAPAAQNVVVNVDVAGQVTWTGSTAITLVATTSLPIVSKRRKRKPKRIVRGSRVRAFTPVANVVINIDVAGQITWTGSSAIMLVATTSIPITVRRRRRKPKKIVRGPRIARFTALVAGIINVDTPGQITWAGQTIGLKTTITPTPGAITWTGQTVGLTTSIIPTPGAITWAGQAVGLQTALMVVPGQITWTGSTITLIGGEPPGLAVDEPKAELLGPFGEGFLVNAEGKASLTGTEGTAQNQGEEGKAILVEV